MLTLTVAGVPNESVTEDGALQLPERIPIA
jgi:hypothetical protein